MNKSGFLVTAWNNGSWRESGAGYGLRVSRVDRDKNFVRDWGEIEALLGDSSRSVRVNIDKDSFWVGKCTELIKKEIGLWLIGHGMGRWTTNRPPRMRLIPLGENRFRLLM